ncbi:MAG TPA: helical backbone metal receptor [bacterium]|nr:helical backbone metal receptor [bacterium]
MTIIVCAALAIPLFCRIGFAAENNAPARIVCLSPHITEEIFMLGAQERLVGCTTYCVKPDEALRKEKVGAIVDVNLEKIVSLRPDVVLATGLTDPRALKSMRTLGIAVELFYQPKNLDELCGEMARVGKLVGKEQEAQRIVEDVRAKVDRLGAELQGKEKVSVFVEVGAKPLVTVSEDSYINDLVNRAGGVNIAGGGRTGIYSREAVITKNPEVIIIITMGILAEQEKAQWMKARTLRAARNGRVHLVDAYTIGSLTPVSFVESLEEFVRLLHPDVKKERP